MAITPEQARAELARRELARRAALKQTQPAPEDKGMIRRGVEAVVDSPALPIAGGIVGGVLGAPLGPGAVGTAALGGAAGEAYRQLGARALGMDTPDNPASAAKEIGISAGEQAVGEGAGQLVGAAAKAAVPYVKPLAKKVGGLLADFGEVVTKIPAKDFKTLYSNPSSIIPGTLQKASDKFGEAMSNAGIKQELTDETVAAIRRPAKFAFDTFQKIVNKEAVTGQEALNARQAIDAIYPVPNHKNGKYIRMLDEIRGSFQKVISETTPELQAASKEYAIAKAGNKFLDLFPRNERGNPALFRTLMMTGAGLGGVWSTGDTLKGLGSAAAISPLGFGAATSLAGAAAQLGFGARNPALGRLITAGLASQISRKKTNDDETRPVSKR